MRARELSVLREGFEPLFDFFTENCVGLVAVCTQLYSEYCMSLLRYLALSVFNQSLLREIGMCLDSNDI